MALGRLVDLLLHLGVLESFPVDQFRSKVKDGVNEDWAELLRGGCQERLAGALGQRTSLDIAYIFDQELEPGLVSKRVST